MNEPSACPQEEQLRAFLLGQVRGPDADTLADHLTDCPHCAARLSRLTPVDPLLDLVRTPDPLAAHLRLPAVQRLLHTLRRLEGDTSEQATVAAEPHTPAP